MASRHSFTISPCVKGFYKIHCILSEHCMYARCSAVKGVREDSCRSLILELLEASLSSFGMAFHFSTFDNGNRLCVNEAHWPRRAFLSTHLRKIRFSLSTFVIFDNAIFLFFHVVFLCASVCPLLCRLFLELSNP